MAEVQLELGMVRRRAAMNVVINYWDTCSIFTGYLLALERSMLYGV